jgi:sucrose-6-phosphate hydrolase SacC (GH32 family)
MRFLFLLALAAFGAGSPQFRAQFRAQGPQVQGRQEEGRQEQGPQVRQTPVVPAPKRRAVLSGAAFRQALAAIKPGQPFEIKAEIEARKGVGFGFQIPAGGDESVVAGYDAGTERFYVDRRKGGLHTFHPDFPSRDEAPLQLSSGKLRIQIIVDKSSIEVFAEGDHPVTFTHVFYPRDVSGKVRFYEEGGTVTSVRGTARMIQH